MVEDLDAGVAGVHHRMAPADVTDAEPGKLQDDAAEPVGERTNGLRIVPPPGHPGARAVQEKQGPTVRIAEVAIAESTTGGVGKLEVVAVHGVSTGSRGVPGPAGAAPASFGADPLPSSRFPVSGNPGVRHFHSPG